MVLTGNSTRNMEKRRETSRYAARDRRGKETEIFSDLRAVVPIVGEGTITHLDRIAILRVSSAWCRLRKIAPNVLKPTLVGREMTRFGRRLWCEDTLTESLDGFVIIADSDATILCVTESVCLYLGLSQTDLVGRSLKDFLHPSDYTEYMELTGRLGTVLANRQEISKSPECGMYAELRMKTVITQRGRNLNLKSAIFKSVSFILRAERSLCGHVVRLLATSEPAGQGSANVHATTLTKFADTPTGSFMTRHTSDMRISYVHDRLNYILRNDLKSLTGANFFELVDPNDLPSFRESMVTLFAKGHVRTLFYRLLAANNTVVWVTTDASVVNHTSKGVRSQYVICIHHIAGIMAMVEGITSQGSNSVGCTTQIKQELDDTRDYAGRQPHVDATGAMDFQMQPLTGREDFSMMTRLLSFNDTPGTVNEASGDGSSENSNQAYSRTFFRGQSQCPEQYFGQQKGKCSTCVNPLATTHVVATPSRGSSDGRSSSAGCGCIEATEDKPSSVSFAKNSSSKSGFCNASIPSQSNFGGSDRCMGSSQSSPCSRGLSTVCASDNIALSSLVLPSGGCDDTSSLLSSLSAAFTGPSTNGQPSTVNEYPELAPQRQSAPVFESLLFEEPNLDDVMIRAPYNSQCPCENTAILTDNSSLGTTDMDTIDLSSEEFNSIFEQVISQSRPSAGRAVLRYSSPSDPYMQHYSTTDSTNVGGLPGTGPCYSTLSPSPKQSVFDTSEYDVYESKPSSMSSGSYCSSDFCWPNEAPLWSNQERSYQPRECVYRQV
ncbi:PAS fold [Parelaphostrongylus tenuis]|uniref:PAS fold n=1 Tax=Parelaphostrongylus tenuis TaxID=148309 RepID=A0AAD5WIN3_PARTN|nr:PAS fold [Parelaphostrongylus tenuis]